MIHKPIAALIVLILSMSCQTDHIPYQKGSFLRFNGEMHYVDRVATDEGGTAVALYKPSSDSFLMSGFHKIYYPNQRLGVHKDMLNGKQVGAYRYWLPDGKSGYRWRDPKEQLNYEVEYDKHGNISREEGILLPAVIGDSENHTHNLKVLAIAPPHLKIADIMYRIDSTVYERLKKLDTYYQVNLLFGDSIGHEIDIRVRYDSDTATFDRSINFELKPKWK